MSDFNQPTTASNYSTEVLQDLKGRDVDAITLCLVDPTNIPVGAIKYVRASNKFQEWDGAAWQDKTLSIAAGGTGAITAAAARTALGLGTMAVQASSGVSITGGAISGVPLNASDLASGTVAPARLGSGSGGAGGKALYDDNTWKVVPNPVPVGFVSMWLSAAAPTGWVLLNGQAISRATYAVLFALWGTTYGVGDGATTFNVPDMRGYMPFGKTAAGTGSTLGGTFGILDHSHTVSTNGAHTHTVASHSHSISADGAHSHSYVGTTGNISGGVDMQTGGGHNVADNPHTHDYSGNTDPVADHSHTGSTGNASPATDSQGSHNHTTGTNNPPSFAVNFIALLG